VPPPPQRVKFHENRIPVNVPETELRNLKLKQIPAKKGDLIVWRRELAHGNGHNTSNRPRLAQYINLYPARGDDLAKLGPQITLHPERRFERLRSFENQEEKIELTELGKKLLGIELWE
jgi:ectoine hydroxylase-related dioxygenase (phytanoyl-CoA dioxygenase family)